MRQGGEPQGVQVVRQGEPTPYHCDFNPLYFWLAADEWDYLKSGAAKFWLGQSPLRLFSGSLLNKRQANRLPENI